MRSVCHFCAKYLYIVVCCSVLQCVAVCCRVLQCVAVCCSVLQGVAVCCSVLQCVAAYCSVLQCVAVCCSVLQCLIWLTDMWHASFSYSMSQSCVTWPILFEYVSERQPKRTNIHPEYNQTLLHETWPIFMFYDWFICNLLICNHPLPTGLQSDMTIRDMTDFLVSWLIHVWRYYSFCLSMLVQGVPCAPTNIQNRLWLLCTLHDSFLCSMIHSYLTCLILFEHVGERQPKNTHHKVAKIRRMP